MSTTSTLDSKLDSLNKLLATTPVQSLIDSARYVENLEGGNETRYNPVSFGGRDWIVGPSGDSLVALSTDQSGLGPKEKRYDVLDANGNLTQGVSKDRSMGERFLRDLPKIAAGTAFVLGAPALLNAASGLFSGAGAAAGATGAGALGTGTGALTGTTGLLGAESALAVAGVEGAASQLATTAYANAIAAGATPAIASIAADTAAGLVGSGLTDAAILSSAAETAAATAATGAAGAAGNIVGGGGAITAGTTGALTGANALAGTVAGSTAASTAAGAGAGSTVGSTLANAAKTAATTLLGGDTSKLLSSGVNLSMVQDAADKLRAQGALSQKEYSTLAQNLQDKYRFVGQEAQTGLLGVADKASSMVGNFTPYGVTNQLFGTTVNPQTGALETKVTPYGEQLYKPFADVAAQSAEAAEMTNVDQLAKDYYAKVASLSAPEIERQRLATEERLRAQGRLGVSGSAFGGSSPELLAQEQAIARQQLERELQSRQAALGERGALINQGTAAYSPISNLLSMQAQQQQLSGQLGQMAQQGRIAAAQLYAQPAAQAYTQPLQLYNAGLNQIGQTERTGIASNLASQQAALDALAIGRTNVANNLLGANGANVGNIVNAAGNAINAVTGLFNQPSNYVPGTDITYADALAQGLIAL